MIESSSITSEILSLIEDWEPKLIPLSDEIITRRLNNQNRPVKQILGHLIDSTSNNSHRIVHLQYQPSPLIYPNYATFGNNDHWISKQDYQNEVWTTMIQLWKYSLLRFCHIINTVYDDKLNNEWVCLRTSAGIIGYIRQSRRDLPGPSYL